MSEIRDAGTVVVLREYDGAMQVFMMRRHHGHAFMAERWVFPGGRIEASDRAPELAEFVDDFDNDEGLPLALYIAALRETFEEAGLLFARRCDQDSTIAFDDCGPFAKLRAAVDAGEVSMLELCRREDLRLRVEALHFFAHWITPEFESRRYDTRFFAAVAPDCQVPCHDDHELTHSAWWTPREAIEKYRNEQILLAPPTLCVLEELSNFASPDAFLADLPTRQAPPTILPHPTGTDGGEVLLLLPGDPEYPHDDPALAAATPISAGKTRILRRDGQWYSLES